MHLVFLWLFWKMLKVLFTVVNFNNLHFFKAIEIRNRYYCINCGQITSICFEKRFLICTIATFLTQPKFEVMFYAQLKILSAVYGLWQYGLWSFQRGGTKLERFLPKNQHTIRKLLNFENWISGGLRRFQKSEF